MNDTIVLCHGRNHRNIKELNYKRTTFTDANPEVDADYILDITDTNFTHIGKKFNNVINAFCPISLNINNIITDDSGLPIDGDINDTFMMNIKSLLVTDGHFYSKSFFTTNTHDNSTENNQLMIDKLYVYGFMFVEIVNFTFDETVIEFIKFCCGVMPNKRQSVNYLTEMIKYMNNLNDKYIEYVYYSYFSYTYDENITQLVKVNIMDVFELRLPYKNIEEDHEMFVNENEVYAIDDIIHLEYRISDGTRVKLF